ncbi:anti-sigma F factor antagonist [Haloimpatiens lingqiaonensis]|uniref:anti-sigma F factor antagonist n=1 Tax=Haloimpatiens lingqiaonensis TaxID=1380675 RepID=UPI0010FD0863|nr:anti-sigma F factor antagonist [Haloimpatiens lingqiaonensis]
MYLKFDKVGDTVIAYMMGELDHHSAEEVRNKIDNRLDVERVNKLIMDFSGVTFMDSSGIGVVIGRYKRLSRNGGKVVVTNVTGSVSRVFELSGMFKIINLYNNIEEAVNNI